MKKQNGAAERIWVMDLGIPTEETLALMSETTPPVRYLFGIPKGKLTTLETPLLQVPWKHVRPSVKLKLIAHEGDIYVLAQSEVRIAKERAMRRRLRAYLDRLAELQKRKRPLQRDALDQALGAARKESGRDSRHGAVKVTLRSIGAKKTATLAWKLDRAALRQPWHCEGRYLLRTNMMEEDTANQTKATDSAA